MYKAAEDVPSELVALDRASVLLQQAHGDIFFKGILRVDKLLKNVSGKTVDVKFRLIKLTNPIIVREVIPCSGAVEFIQAAGFRRIEGIGGGMLELKRNHNPVWISTAIERLRREARRRVFWAQPEFLSAPGFLSIFSSPYVAGRDCQGAPLCIGRASSRMGDLCIGATPLVASSSPAQLTPMSSEASTMTPRIDRNAGCRAFMHNSVVVADSRTAGGAGYEVLCCAPTVGCLPDDIISTVN
jgi:hypothetical protein